MDAKNLASMFDSAKAVRLRPGDVLIFRCPHRLSDEARARAGENLNEIFGDFDYLILDGGQDIAIVRPEPGIFSRLMSRLAFWKTKAP